MSVFSDNLSKLVAQDENVTAAAARIGVNRSQINRYKSGAQRPTVDVLIKICKAYGTDERIISRSLSDLAAEKNAIYGLIDRLPGE